MKALLLTLAVSSSALLAEDVTLEWVPSGFSSKIGLYSPQRAELSATKPENVTKVPEGVNAPQYTTIPFGPADAKQKFAVLVDASSEEHLKMWMDANGNGDLTDDPPVKAAQGSTHLSGTISMTLNGQKRDYGLRFYRLKMAADSKKEQKPTLIYYRDFGLSGKISLNGKTYTATVSDETAQGDFTDAKAKIAMDLNEDGKITRRAESFSTTKPFNIGGTSYEIKGLTAGASSFQIVKSGESVEEKPVPSPIKTGVKSTAFEATTIDGRHVRFPDDYKGKIVLLDFWATWCGPCLAEVPNVKRVYEEFRSKGFEVLGISLDNEKTLPKLEGVLDEKDISWPQIADGKGWESGLAALFGVESLPSTFLVDGTTGQFVAATRDDLHADSLQPTVEHALAHIGDPAAASNRPAKTVASAPEDPLVQKARSLLEKGTLMPSAKFLEEMKNPKPATIALRPPGTEVLRGREIAARADAAHLRVGWMFQCTRCTRWHSVLAGGYAIARDTVVTAHHVLEAPPNLKPGTGCPVILRGDNEFVPILSVLVDDSASDTIILRVGVDDLQPLSLAGDVCAGDTVFCLSDPRGVMDYFSTGIVNRRFTRDQGKAGEPRDERLHVSTDWAQGSSGAAVLDQFGNVAGHVSKIRTLFGPKPSGSSTAPSLMNLHEAVPVSCVRHLVEKEFASHDEDKKPPAQ